MIVLELIHCIKSDYYEKGVSVDKFEDFEISSIYNRAVKYLLVSSIVMFSLSYKNISYALGFVLGGAACLMNFNLLVRSLEGMISKTTYSKAFFNWYFLLRLFLVLAVLCSAIMLESVNLLTAVLGILTIRIVITWEALIKHIKA